ncbi:hypothetical protein [Kitasatospora sp. NPDC059599]|uniref:hypothetical protein n=1 Tax=Kitasatospora sp. NPDC059599 TaxID=3346880 RepID=UPI0036CB5342
MAAERPEQPDGFEEELAVRLGTRAGSVAGSAPLAALRDAGRRRARWLTVLRGTAAVVVLAAGVGMLSRLGDGGGPGGVEHRPPAGAASPTPGVSAWNEVGPVVACEGPTSLRTPGWHDRSVSPSSGLSSSGLSSSGLSSSGGPTGGRSSSGFPSGGSPSSGGPSTGFPSGGSPSGGGPSGGVPSTGFPAARPTSSGPSSPLSSAQLIRLDLARAGEAVDRVANTGYRDHYFGSCRDAETGTLYVMRVPGSALDAAAAGAAADWPSVKLQFTDAAASRDEQEVLVGRIDGDRAYWHSEGVEIGSVAVGGDGAGVVVGTPQWESAGARIKARYGPLVVEVR